jgi:hypothetical protein
MTASAPKRDPQTVKAEYCEHLADVVRAGGALPDARRVDEIATDDLHLGEAVLATRATAPARAPAIDERDDPAAELAEQSGAKLWRGEERRTAPHEKPIALLDSVPDAFWQAAIFRIAAIVQLRPGSKARELDFASRKLGQDFIRHYWDYRRGEGEYVGHKPRDAARIFRRRVEDICDRSVAIFGAWR